MDEIGVSFLHARLSLRGLACLFAFSVGDERCGVTQLRVRRLRSALSRITFCRFGPFTFRGEVGFALLNRRKFTFCGVLRSILIRGVMSGIAVLVHVLYPVSVDSIDAHVIFGLRRWFIRVTIAV